MKSTLLLSVLVAGLLVTGGCSRGRDLQTQELQQDNERLASQVRKLTEQVADLVVQRDEAREAMIKSKENLESVGKQISDMGKVGLTAAALETVDGNTVALKEMAFARGSDELTAEGKAAIQELAKILNGQYNHTIVRVIGHTDDTPVARKETKEKFHDNWGLSAMRARTVIAALQAAGVEAKRLQGGFAGEHQPRSKDKAANRRVEVKLFM